MDYRIETEKADKLVREVTRLIMQKQNKDEFTFPLTEEIKSYPEVMMLFREGRTIGIPGFEMAKIQHFLRELRPRTMRHISKLCSLYYSEERDKISQYIAEGEIFKKDIDMQARPFIKVVLICAFLKTDYPEEYMTVIMKNSIGNDDLLRAYMNECGRLGVKIAEDEKLLSALKNLNCNNSYVEDLIEKVTKETFDVISKIGNEIDGTTPSDSRIVFPEHRAKARRRVSEQELKQIFIEIFNKLATDKEHNYYYSVETPTKYIYNFSNKGNLQVEKTLLSKDGYQAAMIDLTIYDKDLNRIAIIEFKKKNSTMFTYEKDFLKLKEEDCAVKYFIQIAETAQSDTFDKFKTLCKDLDDSKINIYSIVLEKTRKGLYKGKDVDLCK